MNHSPDKIQPQNVNAEKQSIVAQLVAATLARFVLNTARRFAYPFAPALSRGLDVPMTAITSLIAINQITAVLGVLFGPLTDRWGYRRMMISGMVVMIIGMCCGGLFATYLAVFFAMLMAGLGKSIYDPAIQAFVGKNADYRHRGRAVGFVETSWAGSSLIGIPIMGFMMQWGGWQTSFWILGAIGAVCLIGLVRYLSPDIITRPKDDDRAFTFTTNVKCWGQLLHNRPAVGAIGFGFFFSAANDNLFVVLGAWMESAFGLGLTSLGLATAVIGVAELAGEGLTALMADKVGLKRAAIIGAILSITAYLLLTVMGHTLTIALVALFLAFLAFEFTIVTSMSLCTELHPSARATMIAGYYAISALGRVVGAFSGGLLWTFFGWHTVCLVSAFLSALGVFFLVWGLRHWYAQ